MTNIKKDFASPNGPILLLSAKGSTTASIAEANGVKDFSGNGNHGQASSGMSIVNDEEKGTCFYLDGTANSYATIPANLGYSNEFTLCTWFKKKGSAGSNWHILFGGFEAELDASDSSGAARIGTCDNNNNRQWLDGGLVTDGKWHHITGTVSCNGTTTDLILYVDGEKVGNKTVELATIKQPTARKIGQFTNTSNYKANCYLYDPRIYPRALSAAEVKYLYNGFQPNIIVGQTIPSGAILDLSARGLTTAGIAQANGVIDRSGNGNHGQAYNGVAVVNDDEMGSCFSFDGSNDVIAIGSNNLSSYFNDMEEMSLSLLLRVNAVTTSSHYLVSFKTQVSDSNQSWICLWSDAATNKISFTGRWKESDVGNPWTGSEYFLTADLGTVYHATVVCDFKNGIFKAYVNGVLVQTTDNLRAGNLRALYAGNNVFFGALNDTPQYGLNCSLADIRIYPRALTASEVQQLADASLKKIRGVSMGSDLIKHIYYGSNLIYAKTDNYEAVPSEVTFKLHQLTSTTQRNTIEYAGSNINYRSITYSNGTVNMGNWSDWINDHFTPVMLKNDGTVDYELNRNNLNYKADGVTASDIANTSYAGNAMLQIKKFYISSSTTIENGHTVFTFKLSDIKKDSSYTCWGFVNSLGEEQPYVYYGLFHGYVDGNSKLRSMSGITLSSYTHTSSFNTMSTAAKANGLGWDISNYPLENAIGLVLMMIYKDVNPLFVNQDSSNNYRESSVTPYATTGALAASGGFPWITTSMMQKALWIECFWRSAAVSNLAASIWTNGIGSLRGSSGFDLYYRLKGPYNSYDTPEYWKQMSDTTTYVYASNSHQIETATIYDNMLFPKDRGDNAIGTGGGMISDYYNRFYGGGDMCGSGSSYHSTTSLRPVKTGMYRALDKYAAPPHYMSYHAFGSDSGQSHKANGTARLTYIKEKSFSRTQLTNTAMGSNSRCVFISPAGNMFGTDWSNRCVKIFDSTGTYVRSFTPLSGKIPYAIAGDDTYLYVCYWDSTNIYKYQYSGTDTPTLIDTWTAPVTQSDGATIYGGYLYVASQQKQLYRVNLSTGAAETLITSTHYVNAVGIDTKNNRIVTIHNGGMTTQYVPTYTDTPYARIECYDLFSLALIKSKILDGSYTSKINNPQGLVVDSNGNLYLGGAYSINSSYDQGLLVLNDALEIVYDISSSVCPTFCYSFSHDSYHNRIVWIGSDYGASQCIFAINL